MRPACADLQTRTAEELIRGGMKIIELVNFHRAVIHIHKQHEVFRFGSFKYLYGERNVISYGRFSENSRGGSHHQ